jgi:hypothetical protein
MTMAGKQIVYTDIEHVGANEDTLVRGRIFDEFTLCFEFPEYHWSIA